MKNEDAVQQKIRSLLLNHGLSSKEKIIEIDKLLTNATSNYLPEASSTAEQLVKLENKHIPKQIPTGYQSLDARLGGLHEHDIWILGSRPSMGITQVLTSLSNNFLENDTPVLYISVEHSCQYIMHRFLATIDGLSDTANDMNENSKSLNTFPEWAKEDLKNKKLFLSNNIEPQKLPAFCINLIKKQQIKVIVIDTLDEVFYGLKRKEKEAISKELVAISKLYKVAIIIGSQLPKSIEKRRGDMIPFSSDFRLNKYLERVANKIIALYRPEYYGLPCDENGNDIKNVMFLQVLINRTGPVGRYLFHIDFAKSIFSELDNLSKFDFDRFTSTNVLSPILDYSPDIFGERLFLKLQLARLEIGNDPQEFVDATGLYAPEKPKNEDDIIVAFLYYLQIMDIEMLDCLVDVKHFTLKQTFITELRDLFAYYKYFGDDGFYNIPVKIIEPKIGQKAFIFVGNNTGNYFNLEVCEVDKRIIEISEFEYYDEKKLKIKLLEIRNLGTRLESEDEAPF